MSAAAGSRIVRRARRLLGRGNVRFTTTEPFAPAVLTLWRGRWTLIVSGSAKPAARDRSICRLLGWPPPGP